MDLKILDFQTSEADYRSFNRRQYRPLAQHSWAWQKMLAEWVGMRWRAIGVFNDCDMIGCLPFCERETEIGKVIMSSLLPASYGGILHYEECDVDTVYRLLLEAITEYANDNQIDIITIYTAPFREDSELYIKYFKPDHMIEKFYQYIPGVHMLSGNKKTFKKCLKRMKECKRSASKYGLSVNHMREGANMKIKQWYEILSDRYCDIGATPPSESFCRKILHNLGSEGLAEFSYVEYKGRMVAGGIFLYGWCQDIFLRAAKTEDLHLRASFFLDSEVIKKGKQLNVAAHNFQSSPSRASSSYIYKKNWGCLEGNTYFFVKVLTDSKKFIVAGKQAVTLSFPHFFVLPFSCYE